jgi:2-methylcitrate dehydratase PrpD
MNAVPLQKFPPGSDATALPGGATAALASFIAETPYEAIPLEARHEAKRLLLDGIGCALGGYTLEAGRIAISSFRRWGGHPGATIVGDGARVPSPTAAYLNAKLGNLLDMDDVLFNMGHLSPVVQWSALALGEEEGRCGRDLVAAFALGFEAGARVFLALGTIFDNVDGRMVPADTTGFGHAIIGGTAACGRMLGLDAPTMIHALGLGGMHTPAPLSHKSVTDASMAKYQMDLAASGAVLSAVLARDGHTGPATILDDDFYARAMARRRFEPAHLTDRLGEHWHLGVTSIKPYPHCRHTNYALDLVQRIVEKERLRPDEIEAIEVRGFASYGVHPWNTYAPRNEFEAQFSLPYAVAMVAAGVPAGPGWYAKERMQDAALTDLARRVTSVAHPEIAKSLAAAWPEPLREVPTAVTIRARGSLFSAEDRFAKGDGFAPTHRLDDEALARKFRANAEAVLSPHAIETLVDAVFDLERMDSLTTLGRMLAAPH